MDVRLARNGNLYRTRRKGPGNITLVASDGGAETYRVRRTPGGGYAVSTPEGIHRGDAARDGNTVWVRLQGRTYRFELVRGRSRPRASGGSGLSAPMPGQVQKLLVEEGETVQAGRPLLVVEAMKMQLEVKAPAAGRVKRFLAGEGDQVEAGVPLVELEAAE